MNSLYFKIKDTVGVDKYQLLEVFFSDWIDSNCVNYRVERGIVRDSPGITPWGQETFRVDFDRGEDYVAMKLRGVPQQFQGFLEIL